jgi:hypothetical protein
MYTAFTFFSICYRSHLKRVLHLSLVINIGEGIGLLDR